MTGWMKDECEPACESAQDILTHIFELRYLQQLELNKIRASNTLKMNEMRNDMSNCSNESLGVRVKL